jgi:hypothetical protein
MYAPLIQSNTRKPAGFARRMRMNQRAATLAAMIVLLALAVPIGAVAAAGIGVDGVENGTFQVLGACNNGLLLQVTGTGHATYIGDYRGQYRECFDPSTGLVVDGSFTLTTANGDTVFGTFTGQAVPTDGASVHYDDPGVITGGTGRFTGASGSINTAGIADLATGQYSGSLSGNMSRPASP